MNIIYPAILVVALMICYFVFSKKVHKKSNSLNKVVESFKNTTDFNEPSFKFFKALDDIKSSDKIILENIQSKCYLTTQTIEQDLKIKVINILKRVISDLNNILKKDEYFINDIEGLYIIKDDKNNYRIITISMIHDVKNYYSVKFLMDLVFFNKEYYLNYLNIDERATNNILNTYDVRQVDHSKGILFNQDMVNEDLEDTLNDIYKTNNKILDLSDIKNTTYNFFNLDNLSKYYLPEGVPNMYSSTFCDKYNEKQWDSNGNPVENNNIPEACISNNNSIQQILNQPYDAPGVLNDGKNTSGYSWLFNHFSNPGIVASDYTVN
uniref:Uncharacterized protein n=1 Tax=viral metagenome TaxID=1070528 RepID=A0A6C0C5R6_9ZZZZ